MSTDRGSWLKREEILAVMRDVKAKQRAVAAVVDSAGTIAASAIDNLLRRAVADAADRYRDWLPRRALARCPLTGAVLAHSIDTFGLDGPWWNYDQPLRAFEHLPPTFFALRGAMKLSSKVETTAYLAVPGPEVPFVVPRLLNCEGVVAVVSTLKVGAHRAYPICYFASPAPAVGTLNEWGSARYRVAHSGLLTWHEASEPADSEMDFDIGTWIARGKLLWIAPNDPGFRLRSDRSGCPYLDLPGRRNSVRVRHGRSWTEADVLTALRVRLAR